MQQDTPLVARTAKCMPGGLPQIVRRTTSPIGLKTLLLHVRGRGRVNSRHSYFISTYQILAIHNTAIMSFVRPMSPMDLLSFNPCNLDHLTETYNIGFYLEYFTKWPSLCKVIESETGEIEAYSNRLF